MADPSLSSSCLSIDSEQDIEFFLKSLSEHIRNHYNEIYGPKKLFEESYYLTIESRTELELLYHDDEEDHLDKYHTQKGLANTLYTLLDSVHRCPRCKCNYSIKDLISKTYGINKMCLCHIGIVNKATQRWSCCNQLVGPSNACVALSHSLGSVIRMNQSLVLRGAMDYIFFKPLKTLVDPLSLAATATTNNSNQGGEHDHNKTSMMVSGLMLFLPLLYYFYIASHGNRRMDERGSASNRTEFLMHLNFKGISTKIERIVCFKKPSEFLGKNTKEHMKQATTGYRGGGGGGGDTSTSNTSAGIYYQGDNSVDIGGKKFTVKSSEVSSTKIIEYVVAVEDDSTEEEDEDIVSLDTNYMDDDNDTLFPHSSDDSENKHLPFFFRYKEAAGAVYNAPVDVDLRNVMVILKGV
jgi:hypothetical protein